MERVAESCHNRSPGFRETRCTMTALDFQRVREAAGDDPEFIRELMDLYLEDAAERLEELRAALGAGAAEELARCAHKLKGSSANVGATGVSQCAKTLEEKGKAGELGGAQGLIDQADAELRMIATEVKELLDSFEG